MLPPILPHSHTLLDSFLQTARNIETVENDAVECGYEKWSYGDLDVISTGLAIEIKEVHGLKPTISVVSENHPYILAVMLATWKLGGVYAPLDHHAPQELLQHMIINVAPTLVVTPSSDEHIKQLLRGISYFTFNTFLRSHCTAVMNVHYMTFDVKTTSMTTLSQSFLNLSPDLSPVEYPLPSPSDIALFIHTSSASSITNLKCVPLAHRSVISGARSRLAWWKKTWPDKDFKNLRVFGWSPWSHILGICHDLVGAMFATAGCYFFGVIPSTYTSPEYTDEHEGDSDILSRLFDAAIRIKPDVFVGVPWVLEGFKDKWSQEKVADKKEIMQEVLQNMKVFGCAGAALSKELALWAKDMNISVIVDIGMTELGGEYALDLNPCLFCLYIMLIIGGLFSSKIDDFDRYGWLIKDCLIPYAELSLVDEDGNEDPQGITQCFAFDHFLIVTVFSEGELVITSKMISQGYLKFDNSAFSKVLDGRTTFRTGDIYAKPDDEHIIWKGRKDDYIQVCSFNVRSFLFFNFT